MSSITFTTPKLRTSVRDRVLIDWMSEIDNCIYYALDDRGLYFTHYHYDYETQEKEQSLYTPCYFTLAEVFDGCIELQALYEYLLDNNLSDGCLYLYEGNTIRTHS